MKKLDPNIMKAAYIAKNAPSTHEIGWLGHKKFHGQKDKVQVKFDPSDDEIQNQYIYHTHPRKKNQNPLHAMPSIQDLNSAIKAAENGLRGIVIFSGMYYTVIAPTDRAKKDNHYFEYSNALKRGDIEDSIKALEKFGFDIETGEI